jgi:hypothetical protein
LTTVSCRNERELVERGQSNPMQNLKVLASKSSSRGSTKRRCWHKLNCITRPASPARSAIINELSQLRVYSIGTFLKNIRTPIT